MGIIRCVIDAVIISTGAAGIRRVTGYSVRDFLLQRFTNPLLIKTTNIYFDMGESIVNKATSYYVTRQTKEIKEMVNKKD